MMFNKVFYWVINMSLLGSLFSVVLLALRHIKKIPRSFIALLWVIPFIRYVIPFAPSSPYSVFNVINKYKRVKIKTIDINKYIPKEVSKVTSSVDLTATNAIDRSKYLTAQNHVDSILPEQIAKPVSDVSVTSFTVQKIFKVAAVIWVIVVVLMLILLVFSYLKNNKKYKEALHIEKNIYTHTSIKSPMVIGVIQPKILVTEHKTNYDNYVIMHEEAHIKRGDNFVRMLGIATAIIHWFNPIVWYCLKCLHNDLELACDNKVIKKLTKPQQKEYAKAIVSFAATPVIISSAFGSTITKERIQRIISYKHITKASTFCLSLLFLCLVAISLTNALIN